MKTKTINAGELLTAAANAVYNIDKHAKTPTAAAKLSSRRGALVYLFNMVAGMDKNRPKQN